MSKRFTNSDKWKTAFLRRLKAPYKLLWLYILDECDHAGIWLVDFDTAVIKIGEKLNQQIAIAQFGNNVTVFDNGEKWFIPEFIEFQYGTLKHENRAHLSVINLLTKFGLSLEKKEHISPLLGAKDKEQDKDMELDKDKDALKNKMAALTKELVEFIPTYGKEMIREFFDYWAEPNHTKTKMRFEMEKTWDLGKRLQRWKNNNFNNTTNKPTTSSEAAKALFE